MKKEELAKMRTPLSQEDFEKLKRAMDLEEIDRPDIPADVRGEMDKMWAAEVAKRLPELRRKGIFGAYD